MKIIQMMTVEACQHLKFRSSWLPDDFKNRAHTWSVAWSRQISAPRAQEQHPGAVDTCPWCDGREYLGLRKRPQRAPHARAIPPNSYSTRCDQSNPSKRAEEIPRAVRDEIPRWRHACPFPTWTSRRWWNTRQQMRLLSVAAAAYWLVLLFVFKKHQPTNHTVDILHSFCIIFL